MILDLCAEYGVSIDIGRPERAGGLSARCPLVASVYAVTFREVLTARELEGEERVGDTVHSFGVGAPKSTLQA